MFDFGEYVCAWVYRMLFLCCIYQTTTGLVPQLEYSNYCWRKEYLNVWNQSSIYVALILELQPITPSKTFMSVLCHIPKFCQGYKYNEYVYTYITNSFF